MAFDQTTWSLWDWPVVRCGDGEVGLRYRLTHQHALDDPLKADLVRFEVESRHDTQVIRVVAAGDEMRHWRGQLVHPVAVRRRDHLVQELDLGVAEAGEEDLAVFEEGSSLANFILS